MRVCISLLILKTSSTTTDYTTGYCKDCFITGRSALEVLILGALLLSSSFETKILEAWVLWKIYHCSNGEKHFDIVIIEQFIFLFLKCYFIIFAVLCVLISTGLTEATLSTEIVDWMMKLCLYKDFSEL